MNAAAQEMQAAKLAVVNAVIAYLKSIAMLVTETNDTWWVKTDRFIFRFQFADRSGKHIGFRVEGDLNGAYIDGRKPWTIVKNAAEVAEVLQGNLMPKLIAARDHYDAVQTARREHDAIARENRKSGFDALLLSNLPYTKVSKKLDELSGSDVWTLELANGETITCEWHYGEWRITINRMQPHNLVPVLEALAALGMKSYLGAKA